MDRITTQTDGGYTAADPGAALDRLGRFEDFYAALMSRRTEIPVQLEALRAKGKDRTVQFRELMAQKLTDTSVLLLLERYGLK